jgi:hypothetical protein
MKKFVGLVLSGAGLVVLFLALLVAVIVAGVPALVGLGLCGFSRLVWDPKPEPEDSQVEPDYASRWELRVEEGGGVSLYRNGERYTTQHSLRDLSFTPNDYLEVVPPEVMADLRARLPVLSPGRGP